MPGVRGHLKIVRAQSGITLRPIEGERAADLALWGSLVGSFLYSQDRILLHQRTGLLRLMIMPVLI